MDVSCFEMVNGVNPGYFYVYEASSPKTPIPGTVSYDTKDLNTAVYTPTGNLKPGTIYRAFVSAAVKSAEGVALGEDREWFFATASN
jgi:hypothetical protein